MNRIARIIAFLLCTILAVGINLMAGSWGSNRSETAIMTFDSGIDGATGMFAAPWLVGHPLAATLIGIVLPMFLLGLGAYFLVRAFVNQPAPVESSVASRP